MFNSLVEIFNWRSLLVASTLLWGNHLFAADGGITVSSTDMTDGQQMSPLFACSAVGATDGLISPQISWGSGAGSPTHYAIIMHDEFGTDQTHDASDWAHWVVYNIPASISSIARNGDVSSDKGINTWGEQPSLGENRYRGPCPPSGTHNYYFTVYGYSGGEINPTPLSFFGTEIGVTATSVLNAIAGKVTDKGDLQVTFANSDIGQDPPSPGFRLSVSTLTIDENAGTDTFDLSLDTQPTRVVLDITSSNTSEATVSPATLTFTELDWDTAQRVTVTGVNDSTVGDDSATISVSVRDASSDSSYHSVSDQTVSVTLTNDDFSDSIAITNINEYQLFQRNDLNQSDIAVSGTYSGSPSEIEASFNGSAYVSLDASPTEGAFSGTLERQGVGQGVLVVRFGDDTSVSASVDKVGIGDIFVIAGSSNASGRGAENNSYSHPTLKASLFGDDDVWKNLADPIASETDAGGSPWPLVADFILDTYSIPVAFISAAQGGSTIAQWQPTSNRADSSTHYGSMHSRITAAGGKAAGVLFFQGEIDAQRGTSDYQAGLNSFVNAVSSDFSGTRTLVGQIGYSTHSGNDAIRAAQQAVAESNPNALLGPATYDIDLSDDGGDSLHFKSNADMAKLAARWYAAIEKAFYGGSDGYGPILDTTRLAYYPSPNKLVVSFTDDSSPAVDAGSTVTSGSFELKNNGSPVAIASVAIVGNTIEINPDTPLNPDQNITLTYASLNAAVNKAIYDTNLLPAQPFFDQSVRVVESVPK